MVKNEYVNNYIKKRYHSEPEFRARMLKTQLRRIERIGRNVYNKLEREKYAKMSPTKHQARLDKVNKMRRLGKWTT